MMILLQLGDQDWHCTFGLRAVGLSFFLLCLLVIVCACYVKILVRFKLCSCQVDLVGVK
jgi:hypothetical protein